MTPKTRASNCIFNEYRRKARLRGIEWGISYDEFLLITAKECYLCRKEPAGRCQKSGSVFIYSGIDRVNNTLGYTPGNIRACCGTCNRIKSDEDLESLSRHLSKMLSGILEVIIGKT